MYHPLLSISGLMRGCVIQAQLRRPLKFPCEEAEQLLYWVITTR